MPVSSYSSEEVGKDEGSDGCSSSNGPSIVERARGAVYVGPPRRTIANDHAIFDPSDPRLKEDIVRMIIQYLQDEGFSASTMTIQDEASVQVHEQMKHRNSFRRIRDCILKGEWAEVEKLAAKTPLKDHKTFLYAIYKQQYLELIEQMEYQKALALLSKKLKPQEAQAPAAAASEFKDLCYLLTCKSVQEAPSLKSWEGVAAARERLVEEFSVMIEYDISNVQAPPAVEMEQGRLLHLLKQAVRYQIECSRYHPKGVPSITTLLEDFTCFILPNSLRATLRGHRDNVKCVEFVGEEGATLVSGSSDNSLRVWNTEDGRCLRVLGGGDAGSSGAGAGGGAGGAGHTSRVWDVSSSGSGEHVVSASGDASIKLWDLRESARKSPCAATLCGHEGDVYSAHFHPASTHVASGGYDKTVRLWDARTGALVKTFSGHHASVSRVIFNPHGNLVISGSKDSTIKFWDVVSGVCVKTFSSHLGEVTSVEMSRSGGLLLSGSKDNSNRLWDVRLARPFLRFKGHQNTSKNFVRASFGPSEGLIAGGSEDGLLYLWDAASGELLQRLGAASPARHQGIVYRAVWNAQQSLLASCSQDGTVKTWWYEEGLPLTTEERAT